MSSFTEPMSARVTPPARPLLGFLAWLVLCFAAAGIGAIASANAGAFYQQLARPSWAPPAWLFGPVWSVLYLCMAVAVWLVWRIGGWRAAGSALALFMVQLAANALWTWLFFYFQRGLLASVEILLLWALIVATIMQFWRLRPVAGALMLPYLAWVSFASVLSFTMWRLNPVLLGA
jgi:benzodiazapine receptor